MLLESDLITLKAISHAEGAKGAELYSLLLMLALEGLQLHATEGAEVDERKRFKVDGLRFNDFVL